MWAAAVDEQGRILWDYDSCSYTGKSEAPADHGAGRGGLVLDGKPALWERVETLKTDKEHGYGALEDFGGAPAGNVTDSAGVNRGLRPPFCLCLCDLEQIEFEITGFRARPTEWVVRRLLARLDLAQLHARVPGAASRSIRQKALRWRSGCSCRWPDSRPGAEASWPGS